MTRKFHKQSSFLEHFEELRKRLILSCFFVLLACIVVYRFIDTLLAYVIRPVGHLIFTYPAEAFLARISLTFWAGICLAFPFILYEIWRFVSLALTEKEKKYLFLFGPLSIVFFILGAVFAYFVMIPFSVEFFLNFSSELIVPMITVDKYISFVGTMIFSFGLVFELPIILLFLTYIGIATPAFLIQKRKIMIVLIFIVGAIITPPDVVSQILVSVPLIFLYEIGILISKMVYRDKFLEPNQGMSHG